MRRVCLSAAWRFSVRIKGRLAAESRCLPAGVAPTVGAAIRTCATVVGPTRAAPRAISPTSSLLDYRSHVLSLRTQSRRGRSLGLRTGRQRRHSQRERRYSQRQREFFHETVLPRWIGPLSRNCTAILQLLRYAVPKPPRRCFLSGGPRCALTSDANSPLGATTRDVSPSCGPAIIERTSKRLLQLQSPATARPPRVNQYRLVPLSNDCDVRFAQKRP